MDTDHKREYNRKYYAAHKDRWKAYGRTRRAKARATRPYHQRMAPHKIEDTIREEERQANRYLPNSNWLISIKHYTSHPTLLGPYTAQATGCTRNLADY